MKSVKRFLSILTAVAVMMPLVSCEGGQDSREDESDPEDGAEVTEASESLETQAVDPDLLEGTWLTEAGFFCDFDMDEMVFRDSWGASYRILSIEDDHLTIEQMPFEYTYYSPSSMLPVYDAVDLDIAFYGDSMELLGETCYRADSSYGEECAEVIRSRLAGQTFSIGSVMGAINWTVDEDMNTISVEGLGSTSYSDIESFDGGRLVFSDETEYVNEVLIRYVGDDLVWCSEGNIIQITNDMIPDYSAWLMYDAESDEASLITFDPAEGKVSSEAPILLGANGIQDLSYDGTIYSSLYVCDGIYMNNAQNVFMIDMANPFAWELLRRSELDGSSSGPLVTYEYEFSEGRVVFDKPENEWPSDVVDICRANENFMSQAFPDYDSSMVISDFYEIDLYYASDAELIFDYDSPSSSDVQIFMITPDYDLVPMETSVSGGTASTVVDESGVYCLSYNIERYDEITEENYFAMDPHDSAWARSGAAGDIPDLVDMDYIEQSFYSLFVVDSAEDLASLTYFINTYPRDYEDNFFVWVDVTEDIDLSGYSWAPIGTSDLMFCGIFCGNGHTIRGLRITNDEDNNGFFGSMYFSNIVGVTIEDALISGRNSHLMCYDSSTTDFADCHVEGVLSENSGTGVDLFPDYSDYGNNGYHYCSYSITNSSGSRFEDEFSSNYPHPNQENDVVNHFDPDGDGVFDYSEDYFFD